MQFAQQFAGLAVAPCVLKTEANATAYVGTHANRVVKLAVVNKGAEAIQVTLPEPFQHDKSIRAWVLSGPVLDAKTGVKLEESLSKPSSIQTVSGYSASLWHLSE